MNHSRRILAVIVIPIVILAIWLAYGSNKSRQAAAEPTQGGSAQAHLNQAADSIVAAAQQSVPAATSDEEAVNRIHVSIEALRLVGMLGDAGTEAQTAQLLDEVQKEASPAVAEAIIQMRFARHLRQWNALPEATRKAAVDRFVADVKQSGLTPALADFVMRLADSLERAGGGTFAADAITELLPTFSASKDPKISRRAPLMEGIVRRLSLVGKPLELEGTLLDGSQLDWESYRGKVVLVDFFASWCGECRAEVPNLMQNYRAYHDKGFEVVGVNMDNQQRLAESYQKQTGFQFPTLFSSDPSATGWDHPMGRKYGVTALPRAILVDKNGIVVDTVARGQRLGRNLSQLLGSPEGAPNANEPLGTTEPEADDVVPASFEESSTPQDAPQN